MANLHARYVATPENIGDGAWADLRLTEAGALVVSSSLVSGDIAEIIPGTGASNLGKAEDAAHSSGDTGVMMLGVANEANSTFAADGDYTPIALRRNGTVMVEEGPYSLSRKTADGQVKGSAGFIHTITISPLVDTPTGGLLTVYDSLTETGTIVYTEWVRATAVGHTITLDVPCGTGIYVGFDGTLANVAVTVSYR